MNTFIAEIFDMIRPINEIDPELLTDDKNSLSYNKLFSDKKLIATTKINWVYNKLFRHFPSKIFLAQVNSSFTHEQLNDINTIISSLEIQIDKQSFDMLSKEFGEFCNNIEKNNNFLKQEVWTKLFMRGLTTNTVFEESKTLFQQFKKDFDYKVESDFILENSIYRYNPITKRHCSRHKELQSLIKQSSLLTRRDVYIQTIFLDKSFLSCINRVVFVQDDPKGVKGAMRTLSAQKPVIVSEKYDTESHFVCSREIMKYIKCITYGSSPDCTLYVPPVLMNMISLFPELEDDIAYTYFNPMTIPRPILEKLFEYYLKNYGSKSETASKSKTDNCILIIDNRRNFLSLFSILVNSINVDWDVIICTSHKNKSYYQKYIANAKFIDHKLVNIERGFDIDDYNSIMKSQDLWNQIKNYSHALVIQDDGYILRKGIEKFLEYDYVGAPWNPQYVQICHTDIGVSDIGNGGLSLRKVEAMIQCIEQHEDSLNMLFKKGMQVIPEDVFFSKFVRNKPTTQIASQFSFEMVFNKDAIGFHKPWPYLPAESVMSYFDDVLRS